MTEVFGKVYAPAYDLLYQAKDYDREVELLGELFRRYAEFPIQAVLDLGCGTGNHALQLAAKGYKVTGVDRSPEMLGIANAKAIEIETNLHFCEGDIRFTDLGQTFDAVLMMFAVLNYQTSDADVIDTLRAARRHLRPGGLLIFDFWYGPAVMALGPEQRTQTLEQGDSVWARTSTGTLETERNLCHVDFHLRQTRGERVLHETEETHSLRYFFSDELDRFLDSSGFRRVHFGAFPEWDREPGPDTWNALVVATAS